jgi:ATP-dependent RNA helicase RhlE
MLIALPYFFIKSFQLSFNNLQLIAPVLQALGKKGYTTPTPVQEQAIPVILQRRDLLGCAQTGTGKTAAFAIPLLQLMHIEKQSASTPLHGIKALVLTPTRELAIQIEQSFKAYGRHLDLRHHVIFGGVSQHQQVNTLRAGVDILVATPGRLIDLLNQKLLSLANIKYFVLDEADRMLDMGFVHDVKRIIARLPQQKQTLFFSATMPPEIQQLANALLNNPVKIEVTPVSSTADTIGQSIYHVDKQNKTDLLLHLLEDKNIRTVLLFARTKHGSDKIARQLNKSGVSAEAIHGNKSQNARQSALLNFKNGRTRVLVATDIAARGIDIDKLSHVVNFELPNVPETYVHRIGRTGRAGANGLAISFCDREEREFLRDIEKLIKKAIPVVKEHPFVMTFAPQAARVQAGPQRSSGQRPSGQRQGGQQQGTSRGRYERSYRRA